jgi:hypothetical protein
MVELHDLAAISATFVWDDPVKLARVGPRPVRFMTPMGGVVSQSLSARLGTRQSRHGMF